MNGKFSNEIIVKFGYLGARRTSTGGDVIETCQTHQSWKTARNPVSCSSATDGMLSLRPYWLGIEVENRQYSELYSIKCSRTRLFSSNPPPKSQRTTSSTYRSLLLLYVICLCSSFIDFQVWDFPGQIDFFDTTFALDAIFGEMGALIFVVDAQVLTIFLCCLFCIDLVVGWIPRGTE